MSMIVEKIIKRVKGSKLWMCLAEKETRRVITGTLKNSQFFMAERDIRAAVGEVYSELR